MDACQHACDMAKTCFTRRCTKIGTGHKCGAKGGGQRPAGLIFGLFGQKQWASLAFPATHGLIFIGFWQVFSLFSRPGLQWPHNHQKHNGPHPGHVDCGPATAGHKPAMIGPQPSATLCAPQHHPQGTWACCGILLSGHFEHSTATSTVCPTFASMVHPPTAQGGKTNQNAEPPHHGGACCFGFGAVVQHIACA